MTKREYLKKLREYLEYELPESYLDKYERYYDEYIDGEVREGHSLDEVLNDLGDPQLIARTIIDAERAGSDGIPGTDDDRDFYGEIYGSGRDFGSGTRTKDGQSVEPGSGRTGPSGSGYAGDDPGYGTYPRGGIYMSGGSCLIPFLIIILIVFVISSLMMPVLMFFSPLIGPLCIVFLIIWLLGRRR